MYDMRKNVLLICLCLFSASLGSHAKAEQLKNSNIKKSDAPNIVFILTDDLGYGDISALNSEGKITTPHVDKLAKEGLIFTDAHSSSSVCTPTRYSILTGRYNWRSKLKQGVLNGHSAALISPERATIASVLKKKNYATGCVGKWHLGWSWAKSEGQKNDFTKDISQGPLSVGFDYFYGISASLDMPPYIYVRNNTPTAKSTSTTKARGGFEYLRAGVIGDDFVIEDCFSHLTKQAQTYIENQAKTKKPFFLYLPMPAPHTPILPSKEFQGKSGLNPYADYVLMVDDAVGKITKTLADTGIADNTLIVFTSDNGCSPQASFDELAKKGHHPNYIYRGHKADLYEGGHRIPCIVRWPAKVARGKIDQTICLSDFMATFASLAGEKLADNEGEDSYDLSPLLLGTSSATPLREATVHHSIDGCFTMRKGDWKILFAPDSGGWSLPRPAKKKNSEIAFPEIQLYNMQSDPVEQKNVASEHPEVVIELTKLMRSYITQGRSTPGTPQKNDGDRLWRQAECLLSDKNAPFAAQNSL